MVFKINQIVQFLQKLCCDTNLQYWLIVTHTDTCHNYMHNVTFIPFHRPYLQYEKTVPLHNPYFQ